MESFVTETPINVIRAVLLVAIITTLGYKKDYGDEVFGVSDPIKISEIIRSIFFLSTFFSVYILYQPEVISRSFHDRAICLILQFSQLIIFCVVFHWF